MANKEWNGTTGQATLAANWVGGVVAGAGDVAIFNRGSQSIDPSLGNIAALAGLEIHPGYGGNIGAEGNKMETSVTGKVKHFGHAALWLSDAAGLTAAVYIAAMSNKVVVNLGGDTMTKVTLLRGAVTLDGTMGVIALLRVGFVTNRHGDVVLNIVNVANAITELNQEGGTITCNKEIATLRQSDGVLDLPVGSGGDIGIIHQSQGNGRINHYTTATIDECHVGGVLDLGQTAKTVTASTRYPGGRIIAQKDTIHTFTNATVDLAEMPV